MHKSGTLIVACAFWAGLLASPLIGQAEPGCSIPFSQEEFDDERRAMCMGSAISRECGWGMEPTLVQVLIYGLALFEIAKEGDYTNSLVFQLPQAEHHSMKLEVGVAGLKEDQTPTAQSCPAWWHVKTDDLGQELRFEGETIRFDAAAGGVDILRASRKGQLPVTLDEAAAVDWVLSVGELERTLSSPAQRPDSTYVEFKHGTLETCALTFGPEPDVDEYKVCKIVAPLANPAIKRAASEIMVIRWEVPPGEEAIRVFIGGQRVTVCPMCLGDIKWSERKFDRLFNIAIGNVGGYDREMATGHANDIRSLFPGGKENWYLKGSDCSANQAGDWSCPSCVSTMQPACWNDYFRAFKRPPPNGPQRAICPLLRYP